VKIWGSGWQKAGHPEVRRMAQNKPVWGRAKLCVYSGATLSLNHHHPLNDIVGINIRTFELAGSGACQLVDFKEELPSLFAVGQEVAVYTGPGDLRTKIDYYTAHPDEARAIGENGLRRALKEHTARHRLQEILHAVEARFGKRW
jgi:spore maturation protein CgeB